MVGGRTWPVEIVRADIAVAKERQLTLSQQPVKYNRAMVQDPGISLYMSYPDFLILGGLYPQGFWV